MAYKFLSTILGIDANFTGKSSIGTLIASTDYSDALLSLSKSNGYTTQEIRGVNQSTLVLTSGVTANSTTPAIELFNSYNFGIKFIGGTTGGFSNYPMYYYAGDGAGTGDYTMFQVGGAERMRIVGTNVLIGTTTNAGFKLDVNGTTRSQGKLTITTGGAEITGNVVAYTGIQSYGQVQIFSAAAFQMFNAANNSKASFQYINANGLLLTTNSDNISGVLKGLQINPTMVASANNDVLVGLDITPTYTNGAFTGVSNLGLRVTGGADFVRFGSSTNYWSFSSVYSPADNKLEMVSQGGVNYRTKLVNNTYDTRLLVGNYQTFLSFGTYGSQQQMTLFTTGNFAINTTTDAGFKLDVNGTTRLRSDAVFGIGNGLMILGRNTGGGQSQSMIQFDGANGWNFAITNFASTVFLDLTNDGRFTMGNNLIYTSRDSSAVLNLVSTSRGFLPPRMTATQRAAISTPATGLIVYQTDSVEGVYVYTSAGWKSLTMV